MTIQEVFEKYKHLDGLMSDIDMLPCGFIGKVLFDLWWAIKAANSEMQKFNPAAVPETPVDG